MDITIPHGECEKLHDTHLTLYDMQILAGHTRTALGRLQQVQNHLVKVQFFYRDLSTPVLESITQLFNVPQQLHQRLGMRPIPQSSASMDAAEILGAIVSVCSPRRHGFSIAQSLLQYLQSINARVTGVRVTVVYSFGDDDCAWPVVEWTEGDEADGLAIFQFDEKSGLCSTLMHRGQRNADHDDCVVRWEKCSVMWQIGDTSDLRRLFGAAQHILGILEWSIGDILKLYCQSNPGECSEQTLTRYAELIYDHFLKSAEQDVLFDKVAYLLEQSSMEEGKCLGRRFPNVVEVYNVDGKQCKMLTSSWSR